MTDSTLIHPGITLAIGLTLGLCLGLASNTHTPHRHSRLSDHCQLQLTGLDGNHPYKQLSCDSGLWKLYGDTLRVRLR